jgi:Nuclease-related domain
MDQSPPDPSELPSGVPVSRAPGTSAMDKAFELRAATPTWKRVGAFLLDVRSEEQNWRKGADGELRLARHLAKLPCPPWHLRHDLTLSGSDANIDHLVIGPPGVFVINTKNHSGQRVWVSESRVGVGDVKTDYLGTARAEADRVQRLLDGCAVAVDVTPVIAVYCGELAIEGRPADVEVRDATTLRRWLTRLPRRLTPADGVAILEHIIGGRST